MKPSISDKPALIIIFSLILFFSSTSVCYLPPSYSQLNINSPQTLSNTPGNSTDPQIALYNNNLY
ncbi:MAG: hypothetical protein QN720_06615, partial [Nitrososphaeraceae archaeon]|nr:hypothetical protein [Nitrososphaeraceae archaeon]